VDEAERAAGANTASRAAKWWHGPHCVRALHVLPVVTDFLHAFSQIDVRLMLTDRVAHLLDDRIDIAFRIRRVARFRVGGDAAGIGKAGGVRQPGLLEADGLPKAPAETGGA